MSFANRNGYQRDYRPTLTVVRDQRIPFPKQPVRRWFWRAAAVFCGGAVIAAVLGVLYWLVQLVKGGR